MMNHFLLMLIIHVDTEVSEKLTAIIRDKRLCSAVAKLSNKFQTSQLEAFHSLLNHYAPKQIAFSHPGMIARYV